MKSKTLNHGKKSMGLALPLDNQGSRPWNVFFCKFNLFSRPMLSHLTRETREGWPPADYFLLILLICSIAVEHTALVSPESIE